MILFLNLNLSYKDSPGRIKGRMARYYILQFACPIQDFWKADAVSAGAEFLGYLPDYAFIIRAKESDESKLRALTSVRWLGDYAASLRMSKRLAKQGEAEVIVQLFPGADETVVDRRIAKKAAGAKIFFLNMEECFEVHPSSSFGAGSQSSWCSLDRAMGRTRTL